MTRDERGFALVAVLLVLGLLGIVGAEFAYSMRLEASAMRSWRDNMAAAHLAEAGVEQALRELSTDFRYVTVAEDGHLDFYTEARVPIPRLPRTRVRLGPGEFSYRIIDEQSRINVNRAQADRLDKVLQCLGVDKIARDTIVDSILDWIDPNDEHRLNGAESDDYYLKRGTPYRAHNAPLESIDELRQVKGVTPAIFDGVGDKHGLGDVLSVRGPVQTKVNINTAEPAVLCGTGLSDAEISELVGRRRTTPPLLQTDRFANMPGLGAVTETFRIEAEGIIDGKPRARVTAIVQKSAVTGAPSSFTIVEWSGAR